MFTYLLTYLDHPLGGDMTF